jgi:hypothetical protein
LPLPPGLRPGREHSGGFLGTEPGSGAPASAGAQLGRLRPEEHGGRTPLRGPRAPSRCLSLPSETGFAPEPADRRTPRGSRLRPKLPRGFPRSPQPSLHWSGLSAPDDDRRARRRGASSRSEINRTRRRPRLRVRSSTRGERVRETQGKSAKTNHRFDLRSWGPWRMFLLEPRGGGGFGRDSLGVHSRPGSLACPTPSPSPMVLVRRPSVILWDFRWSRRVGSRNIGTARENDVAISLDGPGSPDLRCPRAAAGDRGGTG